MECGLVDDNVTITFVNLFNLQSTYIDTMAISFYRIERIESDFGHEHATVNGNAAHAPHTRQWIMDASE